MIINDRKDLDAMPKAEQDAYKQRLAAGINRWEWQDGDWVLTQDTATIERFGFTLADFPNAPIPPKPDYNQDERQEKQEALEQIANLKSMLRDTDYVSLPDYDKDKPEVIAQRAEWRSEIRELQDKYNLEA